MGDELIQRKGRKKNSGRVVSLCCFRPHNFKGWINSLEKRSNAPGQICLVPKFSKEAVPGFLLPITSPLHFFRISYSWNLSKIWEKLITLKWGCVTKETESLHSTTFSSRAGAEEFLLTFFFPQEFLSKRIISLTFSLSQMIRCYPLLLEKDMGQTVALGRAAPLISQLLSILAKKHCMRQKVVPWVSWLILIHYS